MLHRLVTIPAFLLLLLPSACFIARSGVNAPFDPAAVQRLRPGESTAKDVLAALGAPSNVVRLSKGSAWLYEHSSQKVAGLILIVANFANADQRSDRIWAFFDEGDRLTEIGSTLHAERASYALPWSSLYDEKIGSKGGSKK